MWTWVFGRVVFDLWPPRSPDLFSLALCLRGHHKHIVYGTAVNDDAGLQQMAENGYELIYNTAIL